MSRKANAKEWHEEQRHNREVADYLEREGITLFYVAEKSGDHWPDSDAFRNAGLVEAADKINVAKRMLSEAYGLYERHRRPEDFTS